MALRQRKTDSQVQETTKGAKETSLRANPAAQLVTAAAVYFCFGFLLEKGRVFEPILIQSKRAVR